MEGRTEGRIGEKKERAVNWAGKEREIDRVGEIKGEGGRAGKKGKQIGSRCPVKV
jgi:hypothetical protein